MFKNVLKLRAVPLVVLLWLIILLRTFLIVILYLFRCEPENAWEELFIDDFITFIKEWFDEKSLWW